MNWNESGLSLTVSFTSWQEVMPGCGLAVADLNGSGSRRCREPHPPLAPRSSLLGRLGIRKPSLPQATPTSRTFSLDDLLKPPSKIPATLCTSLLTSSHYFALCELSATQPLYYQEDTPTCLCYIFEFIKLSWLLHPQWLLWMLWSSERTYSCCSPFTVQPLSWLETRKATSQYRESPRLWYWALALDRPLTNKTTMYVLNLFPTFSSRIEFLDLWPVEFQCSFMCTSIQLPSNKSKKECSQSWTINCE